MSTHATGSQSEGANVNPEQRGVRIMALYLRYQTIRAQRSIHMIPAGPSSPPGFVVATQFVQQTMGQAMAVAVDIGRHQQHNPYNPQPAQNVHIPRPPQYTHAPPPSQQAFNSATYQSTSSPFTSPVSSPTSPTFRHPDGDASDRPMYTTKKTGTRRSDVCLNHDVAGIHNICDWLTDYRGRPIEVDPAIPAHILKKLTLPLYFYENIPWEDYALTKLVNIGPVADEFGRMTRWLVNFEGRKSDTPYDYHDVYTITHWPKVISFYVCDNPLKSECLTTFVGMYPSRIHQNTRSHRPASD